MPLDTIYLARHGVGIHPHPTPKTLSPHPSIQHLTTKQHRLNFTVDPKTGKYHSQFPTPTGNPADPTLTSRGVQQSHELAAYLVSPGFQPKPFRIYSSPYYRCLQTIRPAVEALRKLQQSRKGKDGSLEENAELDVRIENGVGLVSISFPQLTQNTCHS